MPKTLALLIAAALLASACADDPLNPVSTGTGNLNGEEGVLTLNGTEIVLTAGLHAFDECDELLDHLHSTAEKWVGPWGFGVGNYWNAEPSMADEAAGDTSATVAEAAEAGESQDLIEGVDFSGTNVAEQGVDEADLVKTDGRRIFLISEGSLVVVDAASRSATGSVPVAKSRAPELLISDDSLLLVARDHTGEGPETVIQRIDLTGENPAVVETLRVTGDYLSARSVDGVARVIIQADPLRNLPFVYPATPDSELVATEANRAVVRASTLDDWLPSYTHTRASGATEGGLLPDCTNFHVPAEFSGFGATTVLSVPVDGEIDPATAASVLAPGDVVYASPRSLYVSTSAWVDPVILEDASRQEQAWAERQVNIHRFDITDPDRAVYTASGQVPGEILNQFSLSEHDGHLRVVTTTGDRWSETSQSQVRVLSETEGRLVEVGVVGDIGRGERVYSVRFAGAVGYVVTFRQVDPFYTIDLADPADPTILGELKIPGFSSYLHPIGDGLVLGVGSDADADGSVTGAKVSLFDVTDLTEPREVALWTAPDVWHDIGWDHRAFLWWAPENLAVIPIQAWNRGDDWAGAVVLHADDNRIRERGRVEPHWNRFERIRRSIVIGNELWTFSYRYEGAGSHDPARFEVYDLDTLELLASVSL